MNRLIHLIFILTLSIFGLILTVQPAFTQNRTRTIPIESGRDLLIQVEGGIGVSQYSFGQDNRLLEVLDKQYDISDSEMNPGASFHFGTSVYNLDTGLRLRLAISSELVSSESSGNIFEVVFNDVFNTGNSDYTLNHRIQTVNIHLERLFNWQVKNSSLNYGLGVFFGWVNDTRTEELHYLVNGSEKKLKDILNIEGRVAGINLLIGRYFENKVGYFEVRPGYQFHISKEIKTKPTSGKSSEAYQPSFEMFYVSLVIGLTL